MPVIGQVFGGMQITAHPVRLYLQLNLGIPAGVGAHGGLRVAF